MSKILKILALSAFAFVSIAIIANWNYVAWYLNPDTLYDRALDQVEAGEFAEARVTLAKLKRKRPPTTLDHGLQARVEIAEGKTAAALVELAAIPDDHALATWARMESGRLEREAFRFRAAEKSYLEASKLDDSLIDPRRQLIYIYGMQLRRQEMHEQFEAIAKRSALTPKEIYVWCLVRDLAWWEATELVPILNKAVAADPSDDRSRVALAESLHRDSATVKALELLEAAPADSPYVRVKQLEILLDRDGPEAIRAELARFEPGDPLVATLRGRLALLDGDGSEAVRCFEIARRAEPDRRQVVADLGRALALVGQKEQAKALTDRAGKIDTLNNLLLKMESTADASSADQWRNLAKTCEAAGRLPEARAWYGLILRKSPLDEEAQSAIFRIDTKARE